MAKIDVKKFLGKKKSYVIGGETVEFEPLTGKDIDLLFGVPNGKESEGVKMLIMHYLDMTSEEFDSAPMTFLNEVSDAIYDINGLKEKKA